MSNLSGERASGRSDGAGAVRPIRRDKETRAIEHDWPRRLLAVAVAIVVAAVAIGVVPRGGERLGAAHGRRGPIAQPVHQVEVAPVPVTATLAPAPPPDDPDLAVIAPPPATFDVAEAPVTIGTPSEIAMAPVRAVTIGIDDYPGGGHDLRFATNDADDMAAVLDGMGIADRIDLRDREASGDAIRAAVRALVEGTTEAEIGVLFFAGHVRSVSRGTEALLAADGSVITDEELAVLLAPASPRHLWIVVAGCYGGGFTEVLGAGRVLTAAAPAGELAYENTRLRRSYLAEYLLRRGTLAREAPPMLDAAFAWSLDQIRTGHPDRQPVQFGDAAGRIRLRTDGPSATSGREGSDGSTRAPADEAPAPPPPPPPTTAPPRQPSRTNHAEQTRHEDPDGNGCTGAFDLVCDR